MKWTDADGRLDIASLQRAFKSGELTPESLIEVLYARMDRSDHPGVWIHRVTKQAALARARALGTYAGNERLPLFGIPFAVKDNVDVAGMPTTAGCEGYAYVPEVSAPGVIALERAGAICLGKTNLDQFATGLVGTRSPYGACRNVFRREYLSGGSSSGSAVAVAAGFVTLALGTDTAGSGRVPAALNNVVGLKPTRGLLPSDGMVPACRSLDCLSVFSLCAPDAALARDIMLGGELPASGQGGPGAGFRFGVPSSLEWYGDAESEELFARALDQLEELGGKPVSVDWAPFHALGELLYGPWVVERHVGVGGFIEKHPDAVLPVTREIILGARRYGANDVFRALYEIESLRGACLRALSTVDVLVTPTVPTHYRLEDDAREPRAINDRLGIYTRFANFVGVPVLAVPAGFRGDGLPFGVQLVTQPGRDARLDTLGAALHSLSGAGMGLSRAPAPKAALDEPGPPQEARLAVVGAHLRGLALHSQLLACGAQFVRTARTEASYRLFVVPDSQPLKPGLVRVSGPGHAIEVELFDLPWAGLGQLMSKVGPPLAIGNVRTDYGEVVKGFVCEASAVEGAEDISRFGGFRAYLEARSSG